jgi:hypothetical protein
MRFEGMNLRGWANRGSQESDNSSALIGLIGRESAVRARRHQAWVEEVPEDGDGTGR